MRSATDFEAKLCVGMFCDTVVINQAPHSYLIGILIYVGDVCDRCVTNETVSQPVSQSILS